MINRRIKNHPIIDFDRGEKVAIKFDNKEVEAYTNETIASSLFASGFDIFSRSIKYHRPRGMFCAIGKCASCMMTVNGIPNVRTCDVYCKDNMKIESQNSWGSVKNDLLSVMNFVNLKPGFYYKMFKRPSFLRNTYLKVMRNFSGFGSKSKKPVKIKNLEDFKETQKIDKEIVVIGGGPAGITAAINAAKSGAEVILVEEKPHLGGQLVKQIHRFFGSAQHEAKAGVRGIKLAKVFAEQIDDNPKIDLWLNSRLMGVFENLTLGIIKNGEFVKVFPKKLIIATGAYEKTLVFDNNDLPGVFGAGGAQTLANLHGVKPGSEAVIIGSGNVGLIVAYQLLQAGVKVKKIIEAAPKIGGYFVHAAKVRRMGVDILTSHTIVKAKGRNKVKAAQIACLDENWNVIKGSEQEIKCDLICISVGLKPTYDPLLLAGADINFIPQLGGHVPRTTKFQETSVSNLYAAGDASGVEEATTAVLEGKVAGLSAAISLGYENNQAQNERKKALNDLDEVRSSPHSARVVEGIKKIRIKD
ncbi:MAG: FAD-dependent oxidoreductase [Candidatus Ranarchaeia archaeon]